MKNIRKLLIVLSLFALVFASLFAVSCGDGEVTDTPTTQLPEKMDAMNYETVYKSKLEGLVPYSVKSSDPWVAGANILPKRNGVSVIAYHAGETDLTVSDCFGFEAKIHVTVAEDYAITYKVLSTQMGDFFEVQTDGGIPANSGTDISADLQKIIDAANPGDTIYFYPGIYKISWLTMREGVHLKLATTLTDAKVGYTDEVREDYESGTDIALLAGGHIMNNERGERGAEGASNFSITGGAFPGYFIFTAADNIQVSNVIVKDLTDAHSFQITGCTNVTIENCMFAGYTFKTAFPREVVQIEQSHPGATGAAENAPLTFQNGELYLNENIAVKNCYFGKSDKMDPPVIAVGHHGATGYATVTGFDITGNVFDGCKYAAIRYTNIVDVNITDNEFIARAEYQTINADGASRPSFIVFYNAGAGMTTYKSVVNGVTVTLPTYQTGFHNIKIENNTFDIEEGSDKRIFEATMETNRIGAKYVSNIMVADSFDARPTRFSGYVDYLNTLENVTFSNNTINIAGQPTYNNQFFLAMSVVNLKVENNTMNFSDGVSFTSTSDGLQGFNIKINATGAAAYNRYIEMTKSSSSVLLCNAAGEELFKVNASAGNPLLTLASDGNGSIITRCEGGNVIVTVTPNEGYELDGWYNGDAKQSGDASISSTTTITAKFVAK